MQAPFEVLSQWSYYNRTGWVALQKGNLDRAEQAFRMAIERVSPYAVADRVFVARSYADLAYVLHLRGRHDEAEPLAAWSLSVRESVPGNRSEALCEGLELLAEIRISRRRDAEAEPLVKRALALREKVVGKGHADLISDVEILAGIYARQGKIAAAEPFYRRALALREANNAESLRQAEEDERRLATLWTVMMASGGNGTAMGSSMMMGSQAIAQVQRLESHAQALREASSESINAAVTTEGYSALLRRAGRDDEAAEFEARARAIRDAVETRAARQKAAAGR